jgi:hypothetical protein
MSFITPKLNKKAPSWEPFLFYASKYTTVETMPTAIENPILKAISKSR